MTNDFPVRFLAEDRTIQTRIVDLRALGASVDLPYEIDRYFAPVPGAFLAPIAKLVTIRCRPEGVANAAVRMRAAYDGQYPRRTPITVSAIGLDGVLVEDGNSTVLNAIASAWPEVLCRWR